jgi:hypothetical protein
MFGATAHCSRFGRVYLWPTSSIRLPRIGASLTHRPPRPERRWREGRVLIRRRGWDKMSTTEAKRASNSRNEDLDVIIVGAGFAGFYLLDRLRGMGMSVQVFEAGAVLAASGTGIVTLGLAPILPGQCISFRATTSGGTENSASSIPRGRKSAHISTTSTKNSTSVGTFASTDA